MSSQSGDDADSSNEPEPLRRPANIPGMSAFGKISAKRVGRSEPEVPSMALGSAMDVSPAALESLLAADNFLDLNGSADEDGSLGPPPSKKPKIREESTDIIQLPRAGADIELADLRKELTETKALLDRALEDVRDKSREIESLNHIATVVEQARQKREEAISEALERLRTRDLELNRLHLENSELTRRLTEAQTRDDEASQQINRLQLQMSEKDQFHRDLEAQLAQSRDQIADLTKKLAAAEATVTDAQRQSLEVAQLRRQMEHLNTQREQEMNQLTAAAFDQAQLKNPDNPMFKVMTSRLNTSIQEISSQQAKLAELKASLATQTEKAEKYWKKYNKLKNKKNSDDRPRDDSWIRNKKDLEEKIDRLEQLVRDKDQEISRLQRSAEDEKSRLQRIADEERSKRVSAEYRLREQSDKVHSLMKERDQSQKEARDARNQLQQGTMQSQQFLALLALQQQTHAASAPPPAPTHYALPPPQSPYSATVTGVYPPNVDSGFNRYAPKRSRASVVEQPNDDSPGGGPR